MRSIEGFATLITGGGSGIGEASAARLAADGSHVTICGRTEQKLLDAVDRIAGVAAQGVTVQHIVADVTQEADVTAACSGRRRHHRAVGRVVCLRWWFYLYGSSGAG